MELYAFKGIMGPGTRDKSGLPLTIMKSGCITCYFVLLLLLLLLSPSLYAAQSRNISVAVVVGSKQGEIE